MSCTFITNPNGDLTNSETEGKDKDTAVTPSEKRKRFFERVEMKKVPKINIPSQCFETYKYFLCFSNIYIISFDSLNVLRFSILKMIF